jgi:hypothetical protein
MAELVSTPTLAPAPVVTPDGLDCVELPLLLALVAESASKKYPPTPVELEHSSALNVLASAEKVISAHYGLSIRTTKSTWTLEMMHAYVVQRRPVLIHLDNLDTSIGAIADGEVCRKNELWKAECAVAGLVEARDERDVKVGSIVAAEREIDESIGPCMATFEDHRPSVDRPCGSIGVRYGLVHSATWNKAFWSLPDLWCEKSLGTYMVSPTAWSMSHLSSKGF